MAQIENGGSSTSVHAIVHCSDLTLGREHDGVLMAASKLGTIEQIKEALRPYYELLVELYENELLVKEEDYRSGSDTYGYENLESIQGSLLYISDRWKACFRVRWLIDLINPNYCLWDGHLKMQ
jgi:hypothetical protein